MNFVTNILSDLFGNKYQRDLKAISPDVEQIREEYEKIRLLNNDELRQRSSELKDIIRSSVSEETAEIQVLKDKIEKERPDSDEVEIIYKEIDRLEKGIDTRLDEKMKEILPEVFAIVKDTARRFFENDSIEVTANDFDRFLATTKANVQIKGDKAYYSNCWMAGGNEIKWDMVHYDVQLFGGVVLHEGKIAEMATGEGKTLVATLSVFLNALTGRGVHIVTVNDYLSKRDSEWMGPIYEFHGLRVDCIDKHEPNSDARRNAYLADITFGTNNEFGFDYLRDNMARNVQDLVQRKHIYAIVDEVDSVLIDDARTPLIISGPVPKGDKQEFDVLKPKVEKIYDAQRKLVTKMLAEAKTLLAQNNTEEAGRLLFRSYKGLPKNKALIKLLSETGNKALMLKTESFYMQDNSKNMHLITEDMYFVIDEKHHSIELTDKGIDLVSESAEDVGLFLLPDIGSELAELEKEDISEKEKLLKKDKIIQDYSIKSERVHTVNQLLKAYTLYESDVDYVVMDNKVKIVDEQTGRILEGRRYSEGLHQAIEAKEKVKVEAASQTHATVTLQNYFRMYKKLAGMTGTAETEAGELWNIYKLDVVVIPTNKKIVRIDDEDLVYKTKREKYNAVIDEIISLVKNDRPVLVGTTSVEVSELLSRMLKLKGMKHNVLNAKHHQREAEIVAEAGKEGTVTIATNMAGRGTDIKITEKVKKAGGLAIIGTERHESRRVDRQLRGRSGRQGDPGSSKFYVCLEDDLMRLFGSDRIAGIMDRLGLKEGEVIQHRWISKSIERAQKKVEENNFGIRKRLLEYDDVMNSQREVIYTRRRHALLGERISVDIANMMSDLIESLVEECHSNMPFEEFKYTLFRTLSLDVSITEDEYLQLNEKEITEILFEQIRETYKRKTEAIAQQAFPVIKDVYENQSATYENIVVPITDGIKMFNVVANLKKSYESNGEELMRAFEQTLTLHSIDTAWIEHLRALDDLKQAVHTAAYEQKDPLLIYKLESFKLFTAMIDQVNRETVSVLLKSRIPDNSRRVEQAQNKRTDFSRLSANKDEAGSPFAGSNRQQTGDNKKPSPVKVEKKVGRNDPCPCGSGKKFKACHGKI